MNGTDAGATHRTTESIGQIVTARALGHAGQQAHGVLDGERIERVDFEKAVEGVFAVSYCFAQAGGSGEKRGHRVILQKGAQLALACFFEIRQQIIQIFDDQQQRLVTDKFNQQSLQQEFSLVGIFQVEHGLQPLAQTFQRVSLLQGLQN
ncbi:MAG: hypothetical protein R3F36_16295 [Candidatus Competibacteraceae bacterium]